MFGWPDHVTLLFLAASFCALCYLFVCARPGRSWLKSVLKTLSVGLLALVAFQLADRLLLGVALTCCAVGDFFLSRTTSDQGLSEAFVTSLGAFGIGHLAYAALFALQPGADLLRLKDGWPLVLALGLLGLVVLYLALRRAGRLRFGVALYIPFILLMGVAAMALPPVGALALVLPAALLFILSDFALAQELFVLPRGHRLRRPLPYVIWSSYWLAQALFLIAFTAGP
ncbi:lysoplasmalogenase family protein [uncultured Lentibacter sp.]|jgi:uncharacterized membrane protein YhhN|uniref:lysoplasmalogenase family protein n=1 Tax=uncultured Lentibacter sp. TaxID=1659309 RepID=UPI00262E3385|nr:lysoplasmalogenase family protein [uncultured Lentibacter sp.]